MKLRLQNDKFVPFVPNGGANFAVLRHGKSGTNLGSKERNGKNETNLRYLGQA